MYKRQIKKLSSIKAETLPFQSSDLFTCIPSISILPELGSIKSNKRLKSVVLPAPLFPTKPKVSPLEIFNSSISVSYTHLDVYKRQGPPIEPK